jgi:hypothetical protein
MAEIDIRSFAADAAEEVVCSHTVGTVAEGPSGPESGIGTGTAVEWAGRNLDWTIVDGQRSAAGAPTGRALETLSRDSITAVGTTNPRRRLVVSIRLQALLVAVAWQWSEPDGW